MRRSPIVAVVFVAVGVAFAAPGVAHASDAEDLFREGVKLLDAGNVHAACDKLAQSQSLEPAAGTLLNLADCYERDGKPALALATFVRARDAATARGRNDWVKTCNARIASLDAKVPRITIELPSTPGVRVAFDGTPVTPDALKNGLRADVGSHVVEASAPGYTSHWGTVDVRASMRIRIPELARVASADASASPATSGSPADAASSDATSTRRTLGIGLVGAGLAVVAFGGVAGLVGASALSDAKARCDSYPSRCSPDAAAPNDRAKTWSGIATGFVIAGAAVAAVGVAIFVWPTKRATATATASLGPDRASVGLRADF